MRASGGVDGLVVGGYGDPRLCQERLTGGRQADAARVTLQQFDAELGLELGDRLRQRGLCDVQLLRGAGDLSLFRHGDEIVQRVRPKRHRSPLGHGQTGPSQSDRRPSTVRTCPFSIPHATGRSWHATSAARVRRTPVRAAITPTKRGLGPRHDARQTPLARSSTRLGVVDSSAAVRASITCASGYRFANPSEHPGNGRADDRCGRNAGASVDPNRTPATRPKQQRDRICRTVPCPRSEASGLSAGLRGSATGEGRERRELAVKPTPGPCCVLDAAGLATSRSSWFA